MAAKRQLLIVEPASSARRGAWDVHDWPDLPFDTPWAAIRVPLPVRAGTPFLRNGWQSWSATGDARLGAHVVRPAVGAGIHHPIAEPPYEGDESYDVLAADGFAAGFASGGGVLVARPSSGDILAVREGAGPHPPLWTAEGDGHELLADLVERVAGRVPTSMPRGWCTWYCRFADITDDTVRADLAGAAHLRDSLDVFQVDDGYQAAVGDWLETNERFPSGLRAMVSSIAAGGFRPGLWTAPFLVAPSSRLANEHPDWFLRRPGGRRVAAMTNPHWGGLVYALDVSRADVLEWIEYLFRDLVRLGFTYLKLDFLYAAAMEGVRARPVTGEQALRGALEAVRRGAGTDAFLLGCGCPLWPAIGVVDAMRIGPDVAPYWPPFTHGDWTQPSLENAWRASRARTPFHGRLWANDPDCVMLRRRNTRLTAEQSRAWARWVSESAQMLVLSDRFEDLDALDLALWRSL